MHTPTLQQQLRPQSLAHASASLFVVMWIFLGDTAYAADCSTPRGEWVFCEDFESGGLSQWDETSRDQDPLGTVVPAAGPAGQHDNHVFRLRVSPGTGGNGINKTFTPDEFEVLFARWYMAYEDGFDFTARNHGHGLHAGDRWKRGAAGHRPQGDDWYTAQVEYLPVSSSNPVPRHFIYSYYRGMRMDCSDPEGACWGDHIPCLIRDYYCDRVSRFRVDTPPPALEHETWYCVEMMVDAGKPVPSADKADGRLNLWVDGREIGPWQGLWFRTTKAVRINHFWLGLFHHEEHSASGILYDDVVVSTARIGC